MKQVKIKSLNKKNAIQNIQLLDDTDIAVLLGAEVDKKTGELIKDKNWICNFH